MDENSNIILQQHRELKEVYEMQLRQEEQLKAKKKTLETQVMDVEYIAGKEQRELEKMKKAGLKNWIIRKFPSYQEKLEKQEQEARKARVKLEEEQEKLASIEQRIDGLQAKKREYWDHDKKYKFLYEQKKQQLLALDGPEKEAINTYEAQIEFHNTMIKELNDATRAGRRVKSELERMEHSLDSAHSYGTWDMLGGGLITTAAKHSHLDDAKSCKANIEYLLKDFNRELSDVKLSLELIMNTDGFAKFADYWLDDLFWDWNMQNRIDEASRSVDQAKDKVTGILRNLERGIEKENAMITKCKEEVEQFIVEA